MKVISWMSWHFIMAAIFDLDAILEFQPYWYSDILKQPPSWNCLKCVDDDLPWLIESCFIGLFRFTVKLSWLWLTVVIDLWLFWISLCMRPFVQWLPIFSFNRALGKMLCNCRDAVVCWILGNSGMAEGCNTLLISDIHDVMSISGAGQVLGNLVFESAWPSAARRGMQYLWYY